MYDLNKYFFLIICKIMLKLMFLKINLEVVRETFFQPKIKLLHLIFNLI